MQLIAKMKEKQIEVKPIIHFEQSQLKTSRKYNPPRKRENLRRPRSWRRQSKVKRDRSQPDSPNQDKPIRNSNTQIHRPKQWAGLSAVGLLTVLRDSHVWRHSEMVVASLKSLLQRGHVMHAAIVSLFTFTTWFDIVSPFISPRNRTNYSILTITNYRLRWVGVFLSLLPPPSAPPPPPAAAATSTSSPRAVHVSRPSHARPHHLRSFLSQLPACIKTHPTIKKITRTPPRHTIHTHYKSTQQKQHPRIIHSCAHLPPAWVVGCEHTYTYIDAKERGK